MLAVGGGKLVLMSTPAGKRGHFCEAWHGVGDGWERIKLLASECPRISLDFLEEELTHAWAVRVPARVRVCVSGHDDECVFDGIDRGSVCT